MDDKLHTLLRSDRLSYLQMLEETMRSNREAKFQYKDERAVRGPRTGDQGKTV